MHTRNNRYSRMLFPLAVLFSLLFVACTTPSPQNAAPTVMLEGTSWQLVKFVGGDARELVPDKREKYTLAFDASGNAFVRFDCNRGRGTWKQTSPSGIAFGTIALTRALCLPPSLHDDLVKRWPYIRSYVIHDGHLFLSMMADGGVFEFEPAPANHGAN